MGSQEQRGGDEFCRIFELGYAPVVHGVFSAALELNLFEIIAKAGADAHLSAAEIASQLPKKSSDAPKILDRMLQLLASQSIIDSAVVSSEDGNSSRIVYGLNSLSKLLVPDDDGISLAPSALLGSYIREKSYSLKDAVLDNASEVKMFEPEENPRLVEVFNQAMRCRSAFIMREILQVYSGFEKVNTVVDVGGGLGSTIHAVVSKHPNIQGINFDLPHVIKNAPAYPGVEHVEGDMFHHIPRADAIILKHVLHDWSDETCLKLLKNCWDALPNPGGKVIVIEMVLPGSPKADIASRTAFIGDMLMHSRTNGGKERTQEEFVVLARGAGFKTSRLVCRAYQYGVIEFHKD